MWERLNVVPVRSGVTDERSVRAADGGVSLVPEDVARCVESVCAACPGVPVGVSIGAWIVPDVELRLRLIAAWHVLPDFASVNVHEQRAARVTRLLSRKASRPALRAAAHYPGRAPPQGGRGWYP